MDIINDDKVKMSNNFMKKLFSVEFFWDNLVCERMSNDFLKLVLNE